MSRPTVLDVIPMVRAYYAKPGNIVGGSLHIVLDDMNVDDSHVEWCLAYAIRKNDTDGVALAKVLLQMSKTQRLKIAHRVYE